MITLEMHNFNNYSIASQHFCVLQVHFFNSFDDNAHDSKGHSHQITACTHNGLSRFIQGEAFNVTYFKSRTTHLLYSVINTTEHGQVSHCLGFTKSLTSSIQRLGDTLHDNQGIAAISQVHLP